MKVLLTGATGYIGKRLLPLLIEGGHQVVCCVRDQQRFTVPNSLLPLIEVIEIDLLDNKKNPLVVIANLDNQNMPDYISMAKEIRNEIELIENLGNEKIVYMKKDEHQLSAKIPSNVEIGSSIGFDLDDIFIFDADGKRVKQ